MKLKRLLIFACAQHTPEGILTREGEGLANALGLFLRNEQSLALLDTQLICASSNEGVITAEIVGRLCDLVPKSHKELISSHRACDVEGGLDVLRQYLDAAQDLIVISHIEMVANLTPRFGRKILGRDDFPCDSLRYCEGYVVECNPVSCVEVRVEDLLKHVS